MALSQQDKVTVCAHDSVFLPAHRSRRADVTTEVMCKTPRKYNVTTRHMIEGRSVRRPQTIVQCSAAASSDAFMHISRDFLPHKNA